VVPQPAFTLLGLAGPGSTHREMVVVRSSLKFVFWDLRFRNFLSVCDYGSVYNIFMMHNSLTLGLRTIRICLYLAVVAMFRCGGVSDVAAVAMLPRPVW
jgi:tryptophan-rich sensory protein